MKQHQHGFTLIELMVSVTIMLLLVGGGIASYVSFNDRQTLVTSAHRVETYLRSAQKKARVGDRPATCTVFDGYAVRLTSGSDLIELIAQCGVANNITVQTDHLSGDVVPVSDQTIRFAGLHGGVQGAGTINLTDGDQTYSIIVTEGGEIEDMGVQEQ